MPRYSRPPPRDPFAAVAARPDPATLPLDQRPLAGLRRYDPRPWWVKLDDPALDLGRSPGDSAQAVIDRQLRREAAAAGTPLPEVPAPTAALAAHSAPITPQRANAGAAFTAALDAEKEAAAQRRTASATEAFGIAEAFDAAARTAAAQHELCLLTHQDRLRNAAARSMSLRTPPGFHGQSAASQLAAGVQAARMAEQAKARAARSTVAVGRSQKPKARTPSARHATAAVASRIDVTPAAAAAPPPPLRAPTHTVSRASPGFAAPWAE